MGRQDVKRRMGITGEDLEFFTEIDVCRLHIGLGPFIAAKKSATALPDPHAVFKCLLRRYHNPLPIEEGNRFLPLIAVVLLDDFGFRQPDV